MLSMTNYGIHGKTNRLVYNFLPDEVILAVLTNCEYGSSNPNLDYLFYNSVHRTELTVLISFPLSSM